MNKITAIISIALITTTISACSEKTQTVEWYMQHPEVLKQEVEKCKLKTLDQLTKDKHCTVVREAQKKAFHEHQRNAPMPTFNFK